MAKKESGLKGAKALFNNTGVQSVVQNAETAVNPNLSIATQEKTKATFYLSNSIQERLDDAVYHTKKVASNRRVNKSTLMEAALVSALVELEKQLAVGEKPTLLEFME